MRNKATKSLIFSGSRSASSAVESADGIDIGDGVALLGNWPGELDLQITSRLVDLNAIVLAETVQEHDSLPEHAIPTAATVSGLRYFHANPNKAWELGRIGGKSKRSAASESVDPLPKLETAMAVRDAVAQLIADVYAGKLHPRVAAGLAPLLNLQLRAIETTGLERRMAKLEKLLAETQAEEGLGKEPGVL